MSGIIPPKITEYPLIRVCQPNCQSHSDCSHPGKRPVSSTNNPRQIGEIQQWVRSGGNYGIVPKSDNDLVILDSDSRQFSELVDENLPETFTVQTGSGSDHYFYRSKFSENTSLKIDGAEFGSVRSENWHVVGPNSVHPETGQEYRVTNETGLTWVPESDLTQFCRVLEAEISSREAGGRPAGPPPPSSRLKASDLSIEPSEEILGKLSFINSDEKRKEIGAVLRDNHPPRNVRVWACSFLYGAVGLRQKPDREAAESRSGLGD
ncbi:MAG: Bifunctional DNA primase/polymerase [uncultured archaeon A07HB70]|jgi:Bifunctional DNA primase/polymerase, N-terminal.|nr:MAG: Bifunctional DNA primase/polymerase [uncultured archaeon A07HB70]